MPATLLDRTFRYHGEATHETSLAFRRRQQERMRAAQAERDAAAKDAAEREQKVRPLTKRRAGGAA